ncbi:carbon-nitrogen hydrolase family protein [Paenarthrobacter sp. CM16]|uniref:carbon-nitrogen hydrolase family protein n=1 Tax=Paenarthrobacter sp. CM16 TaxID=2738447 RepID=UPI00155548B1|nr:carbon-nitrogen hydrolase family protein [Paenarthrobacter sp. CM16]NQD86468.1 carbon-nitrogen hydrolase family protein [Paenarthrobacter sp. CM16]
MRIASGQFSAGIDSQRNLQEILQMMTSAARGGAELLVLPESSLYASSEPPAALARAAQPLDGPFISAIAASARDLELPVVVGTTETNPVGLPFNTVVALDARGSVHATYRKVHLYDAFGYTESSGVSPGTITPPELLVFGALRLGMLTCYDLRFPESARYLVDAGANVLLIPAMWIVGPGKEDHWSTLIRARAIENTAYVIAANQTGPLATGYSVMVDPFGVVMASAGEAPEVIHSELTAQRISEVRARVPSLLNRRFTVVPKHP